MAAFFGGTCCETVGVNIPEAIVWTKPEFEDIRFGFEITMYVATR